MVEAERRLRSEASTPCQIFLGRQVKLQQRNKHASTTTTTRTCAETFWFENLSANRMFFCVSLAPAAQLALLTFESVRTTSFSSFHLSNPIIQPLNARRNFSSNPTLFKKKTRAIREQEEGQEQQGEAEDPHDFSTLNDGISNVHEKLKVALSKLRTGGRFNPEALENLRVHLVKDSKSTERLGDLAQVLPKGGRSLMILVGEKDVSLW